MATTSDGLPYPVGTDLVRDGDNVIASLASAISGLSRWIAAGRVDTAIETNGYARLGVGIAFPDGRQPTCIVATGINNNFNPYWDGMMDGAGALLRVSKYDGTYWGSGATVAFYFVALRPKGSAP